MSDFSIHGLWPGNATGHTPFTCNDPSNPTTVEKVLWKHEWDKHGYCTSEIVPDVEYFNGAITFARRLKDMLKTLEKGDMGLKNHRAYTVTGMKTFISRKSKEINELTGDLTIEA
ncbi:hypothetical protein KY285_022750 [Solanum tuberosum]|nr:hypothetical protein KY285_022750 [Solanum tuberosum]